MTANFQARSFVGVPQSEGGVWYELRAEREKICETLLLEPRASDGSLPATARVHDKRVQARLRLIDEALDRLMAGTYGDCVVCGKWIEDNKLHADPALPFCCGCQRRAENKGTRIGIGADQMGGAFLPNQPSYHVHRVWDG